MQNNKIKEMLSNIIRVMFSNILSVISGIIVGIILPKILTVTDYGNYKTFNLYVAYLGLFTLGITDGIVLDYGGKNYDELNKPFFRTVFKLFFIIELLCSFLIMASAIFFFNGNARYIAISVGLVLLAQNVSNYFQQLSQITQRFKEYSNRNVIKSVFTILSVFILMLLKKMNAIYDYRIYIIMILLIQYILMFWYIHTYRNIVFGESQGYSGSLQIIKRFAVTGFPLLFANLCSTLILTIDRQFVNILFTTEIYAVYAFAYNMLALVTVATSAMSVVIYPMLKRTNERTLSQNYSLMISMILMFVYCALCSYFPLNSFVKWFLPKYIDSLIIFRIIFPGLSISTAITVIMHNYYKTIGESKLFFKKSVIVLIISGLANLFAYLLFKNTVAISVASIITMIFWYVFTEYTLSIKLQIKTCRNLIYMILMMLTFYLISCLTNEWLGLVIYIVAFFLISLCMYRSSLISIKEILVGKKA